MSVLHQQRRWFFHRAIPAPFRRKRSHLIADGQPYFHRLAYAFLCLGLSFTFLVQDVSGHGIAAALSPLAAKKMESTLHQN